MPPVVLGPAEQQLAQKIADLVAVVTEDGGPPPTVVVTAENRGEFRAAVSAQPFAPILSRYALSPLSALRGLHSAVAELVRDVVERPSRWKSGTYARVVSPSSPQRSRSLG
jgi:hypothetical protein